MFKTLRYKININKGTKTPMEKFSCITDDNIVDSAKNNVAVCTGVKNDIIVVDLDTYKWEKDHAFTSRFGDNYIRAFNTLTQESPKGGIHLFFKYDKEIRQTQCDKLQIDIRSDGGYIMTAPSVIDGKRYKVINDVNIRELPSELKEWLLDNLYTKAELKTIEKVKSGQTISYKSDYQYLNIPQELLEATLENLPQEYLDDGKLWFKFTAFMKSFNQKDLWDKLSRQSPKYDLIKNNKRWDSINGKYNFAYTIFKECKSNLVDLIQFKPIPKETKTPDEVINIDKLGKGFKLDKGHTVIKSDTGTGKTTLVKQYINKHKYPFISLVSRVSLADEQKRVFEKDDIPCVHYATIKKSINEDNLDSYICTIDSIKKINSVDIEKYVLFLDEFNSLIEYVIKADKIMANKRVTCLSTLIYFIKNCKQVVATDADISDICFKVLDYCDIKYKYVSNTFKHNLNRHATELEDLNTLIQRIKQDDKYIVCTDSKRIAEKIFIELGEKGTLYTSDSTDSINIEDEHCLIISPKVLYGNDSNVGRNVYCYYTGRTINPANMLQQINRERQIGEVFFCFDNRKSLMPFFDDVTACNVFTRKKNRASIKEFQVVNPDLNKLFVKLLETIDYKYDCYYTNMYAHFINLLRIRGFEVKQFYDKVKRVSKKDMKIVDEWKDKKELWFDDKYNELRDILNLKTKEDIEKFKDVIINPHKLIQHFNISTFLIKDTPTELLVDRVKELDDFPIKKLETDFIKMKVLREFSNLVGLNITDDNVLECKHALNEKSNKKYNEQIRYAFGFKRKDVDFTNKQKCTEQIYMCYSHLFGDIVLKKRVRVDEERVFKYSLGDLTYHSELLNKRAKGIKSFEGCLIE